MSDRRPCKGTNTNVCVAEGCFNEACLDQGDVVDDGTNDNPWEA